MPQGSQYGAQNRFGDVASGAFSLALGAVDKVAGVNTRKRLEDGVETLTDSMFPVPAPYYPGRVFRGNRLAY